MSIQFPTIPGPGLRVITTLTGIIFPRLQTSSPRAQPDGNFHLHTLNSKLWLTDAQSGRSTSLTAVSIPRFRPDSNEPKIRNKHREYRLPRVHPNHPFRHPPHHPPVSPSSPPFTPTPFRPPHPFNSPRPVTPSSPRFTLTPFRLFSHLPHISPTSPLSPSSRFALPSRLTHPTPSRSP